MDSHLQNPHHRAITTLTIFVSFWLLTTLILFGGLSIRVVSPALFWISLVFLIFFALMLIIIWVSGRWQVHQAMEFLKSDRTLIRWTYSPKDWQALKEQTWQEENQDWKVQWGCLTFLLALAGLLTGGMLGIEEGIFQIGLNALLGLVVGALFGSLMGALVAGGNYWGARREYQNPHPGMVALGVNEIFANGNYFKGNEQNKYIQSAKIQPGKLAVLEIVLVFPPRPRREPEETWNILIPESSIDSVKAYLSTLTNRELK